MFFENNNNFEKNYYISNMKKETKEQIQEPKEWKIILYQTENGRCPIDDFIATLTENEKDWMTACIEHLKREGFNMRRPQADFLQDDIYELRIQLKGRKKTRTLYFFCFNDYIVLTHTFIKKTEKIPKNEINKAIKYKNNFLEKYNITNIEEAYNVSGFPKI
jgi:phage-related protein